jgi:hypothetical protein
LTPEPAPWRSARARLSALTRHRNPDDPAITAAAIDLKTARAELYIRELDNPPALPDEVRRHLAELLRPTATGGRAA